MNNRCEHCNRPYLCINGKWVRAKHVPSCKANDAYDRRKLHELRKATR